MSAREQPRSPARQALSTRSNMTDLPLLSSQGASSRDPLRGGCLARESGAKLQFTVSRCISITLQVRGMIDTVMISVSGSGPRFS